MIERIHNIETVQRVDAGRIGSLEERTGHLWTDFKEMSKLVTNIRVDVAKIVVFSTIAQTVLVGVMIFFFTKGR